jgi:NAD(P)-dependent dehydrogenase (short-subunit alcohol dehydrogenase family)
MRGARLADKRAFVTGAASGIGRAVAARFAAEGARVAVADLDPDAATSTADQIMADGGEALALAADVTKEAAVEAAFARAVDAYGGLDVVVINAGVQLFGQDSRVHDLDTQIWDRTHAVNLRGAFLTGKHGVRALLAAGGGSVICTGSPTGLFGVAPACTAYSASKAGIFGLARAIATGYAPDGIRCNVVVPGFTATPLVESVLADPAATQRLVNQVPLRRPGQPEEVASMMLFLASDEAAYVTGGLFSVDGGQTAI